MSKILKDIKIASKNMIEKIKRFDVKLQTNVYIEINNEHIQVLEGSDENQKLYCQLDLKLLRRILDKKTGIMQKLVRI